MSIINKIFYKIVLSLVLAICAYNYAKRYQEETKIVPLWYQKYSASYVMAYCDQGFVQPRKKNENLQNFLNQKTQSIECKDFLYDTNGTFAKHEFGVEDYPTAIASMYMGQMVVWSWYLDGQISWAGTYKVGYVLFGLSVFLSFWFFLLFFNTYLSLIGSLSLMTSATHLSNFPHFRDYGKAPFYILTLIFTTLLYRSRKSIKYSSLYSALIGMAIGIGYGFRIDLIILVPFCCFIVLLSSLSCVKWSDPLKNIILEFAKFVLFSILIVLFFKIFSYPVKSRSEFKTNAYSGNSALQHVVLLGLTPIKEDEIVFNKGTVEFLYLYNDLYLGKVLNSNSYLKTNKEVGVYSKDYQTIGSSYLISILTNFPEAFFSRGIESFKKNLMIPLEPNGFFKLDNSNKKVITILSYLTINKIRSIFKEPLPIEILNPWGVVIFASFIACARYSLASVLISSFSITFLFFYPAIQFNIRHYFQNEVISIFIFLLIVNFLISLIIQPKKAIAHLSLPFAKKVFLRLLLMFSIPASIYFILYFYQIKSSNELISKKYLELPRSKLELKKASFKDGQLISFDLDFKFKFEYLNIVFSNDPRCHAGDNIIINLLHDDPVQYYNYSRNLKINNLYEVLYPIYSNSFRGIYLDRQHSHCVESVSKIDLRNSDFPVQLYLFIRK